MTEQEWINLGIVRRLQHVADHVSDARWRAALDEAIDLLCQAGWGHPIRVARGEQTPRPDADAGPHPAD